MVTVAHVVTFDFVRYVADLCGFWQQEADTTLRKARALKAQRREEYQKANAGSKQLEKKRRIQEEALQKVGRRHKRNWEKSVLLFGMNNFHILALYYSLFIVLGRRRRPRTSIRAAWLTLASEKQIWPMPRAPSLHRSER